MSLEVNKNDQAISGATIFNSGNIIQRRIAGILTTIMLFSGSIMGVSEVKAAEIMPSDAYVELDLNQVIEIPEAYRYEVSNACGKEMTDDITIGDLKNFDDKFFSITIQDNSSLKWLNYIEGKEMIMIHVDTEDTSVLKEINELKGFKSINLSTWNNLELNKEDFSF